MCARKAICAASQLTVPALLERSRQLGTSPGESAPVASFPDLRDQREQAALPFLAR